MTSNGCRVSSTDAHRKGLAAPAIYASFLAAATYTLLCIGSARDAHKWPASRLAAAGLRAKAMLRFWTLPAVMWALALTACVPARQCWHALALSVLAGAAELAATQHRWSWRAQCLVFAIRCGVAPILSRDVWHMLTAAWLRCNHRQPFLTLALARFISLAAVQLAALTPLAQHGGALTAATAGSLQCIADVVLLMVVPMLARDIDVAPPLVTPDGLPLGAGVTANVIMQRMLATERKKQVVSIMKGELCSALLDLAAGADVQPAAVDTGGASSSLLPMRALSKHLALLTSVLLTYEAMSSGDMAIRRAAEMSVAFSRSAQCSIRNTICSQLWPHTGGAHCMHSA